MNDKSLDIDMVERTIQPPNQSFEPTPTETAVPLSEQIEPPPESSTYQWYVVKAAKQVTSMYFIFKDSHLWIFWIVSSKTTWNLDWWLTLLIPSDIMMAG